MSHLTHFLNATSNDPRISASHISLYISLFQCWILNECKDPVFITKREIMKVAKINGIATYHRCIKDLDEYGYIRYLPSNHPVCKTTVYLNSVIKSIKKEEQ